MKTTKIILKSKNKTKVFLKSYKLKQNNYYVNKLRTKKL